MDVTAMLNTASTAAALEPNLEMIHERKDSSDDDFTDSAQTPSATTGDSTAPSSVVATPLEKTPSRRSSDSRAPNRNRTPWDAGGYSLSMALDNTKKLVQTSPNTLHVLPSSMASTTLPESIDTASTAVPGGSTSPRHKFSDSRSSLSSAYTNASSTNSVTHSRISSLSTVSENQPLSNLIADFSLLETRISEPCIGGIPASIVPCQGLQYQQHQHQLKLQQYSLTATQLPPSHERAGGEVDRLNFQPESPTPVRSQHDMSMGGSPGPSPRSPGRAQSPSDAMLIQRSGQPEETDYFQSPSRLHIPSSSQRSQSRGDFLLPDISPTRRHKRAVSAPDFPSIGTSSFNPRFPTFGPIPEPTPSPSQHSDGNLMEHDSSSSSPTGPEQSRVTPDGRASSSEYQGHSSVGSGRMAGTLSSSPMNMSPPGLAAAGHHSRVSIGSISDQGPNQQTNSATSGTELPVDFETASRCMYRGDCQTGSQLRKAISHIFGRNKLCTRMIPTGVWVHYCRKHYQRTRYRNGGEYPQRQIGLVQEQIRRVQAWSDSNAQQSRGPVLKDWSLSVRKREQMRLDSKMAASGKKRPFHEDGMEDEEDNFDEDRAEMSGTAVPEWVVAQIGDGFSTAGILEVVEHLKSDINQGRLQQIPDIEILPNIVTDSNSDEPASNNTAKKTYTKRRTASSSGFAAGGHRRSQSVNTSALRSDSIPMARRSSQPNNHVAASGRSFASEYHHLQPPMEKRQRIDGEGVLGMSHQHQHQHQHQHHHSLGGMSDRFEHPMAARSSFNSRVQLAHRPAFTGIRESHAESHAESHIESQASYYDHQHQRYGDNAGDFYAHQRPIPELTTSHDGYKTDRRSSHDLEVRREHERHHSTPGGSGQADAASSVLPAPNPQRFGSMPVAQQLESQQYILNSTSAAARRPNMHQRSQSEAGFMHHSSSHFERPTSSGSNALPPLQFNAPSRFATDSLTGTNNNGCRHAEEVPRATDYPPYATHASYGGQQAINASSHRVNYGHAHSHSMNHGPAHGHHHQHAHSYSTNQQEHSSSQYVYNSSNRYLEDGRNTQQQQYQPAQPQPPAHTTALAYDPAVAPTRPLDKFEGVRLAPIQDLIQSLNPPVTTKATLATQHTPTPGSDAVQTPIPAPGATPKPGPAEGADRTLQSKSSDAEYLGHPRQETSSAVSLTLALTKETTSVVMPATYTRPISPEAHSISPAPQAQAQGTC